MRRSILDLPVADGRTMMDVWAEQFERLAVETEQTRLRVRIAVDRESRAPCLNISAAHPHVEFDVAPDVAEYRGTGGVVRDLTGDLSLGDHVLVASANQIQRESLGDVVRALSAGDEGVSLVRRGDSETAGVFLLRCGRIRNVPAIGFVDLKEQAIPATQGHARLFVSRRPQDSALQVRTLAEYAYALRVLHLEKSGRLGDLTSNPYAENWQSAFSIAEPGAAVAPGAILQDSVVLAGGRVEARAAVVRSIVCDGAVVKSGQCLVDTLVTA